MNSLELNSLFKKEISITDFKKIINNEVIRYETLMSIKGSSISLNFIDETEINISSNNLKRLLTEIINGNLTNVHIAYISDCLSLSENVVYENKTVKEIMSNFADPEINGGFATNSQIEVIISEL